MRLVVLFILVLGCATAKTMTLPLDAAQLADLRAEAAGETVRLEPLSLTLANAAFDAQRVSGFESGKPKTVPLDSVRAVTWRTRGAGFGRGFLAGIFFGPLLGAAIGTATCRAGPGSDVCPSVGLAVGGALGIVAGPLLFGALGAIIGVENRIDFK